MCKSFSKQKFISVLVAFIIFSTSYVSASINWAGGDITCAESNIDMDFSISGVNNIVGPVLIQANTGDVTATITADAVLKSDNTEKGRIFISATSGNSVTFNVNNNLTFRGSDNNQNPLLIAFSGAGSLIFELGDNKSVSFTSDPTTEGARFFVCMDDQEKPTVRVNRQDNSSDDNVEFVVGAKSCVQYVVNGNKSIMQQMNSEGTIQFDPRNSANNTGCMILRIEDCSCFVVEGLVATKTAEVCTGPGDLDLNFLGFTCNDVDQAALAGLAANFEVICSPENAGDEFCALRIINENQKLPPFRVDTFCDNSFVDANGQRFGFVLGANGKMTIEDCAYLDYIGTATNTCPKQCPPIDCICGLDPEQVIKERNPSAFFVDGVADLTQSATICLQGSSGIFFRSGADVCGNVDEGNDFIINSGDTLFDDVKTPGAGHIVFDIEGKLDVLGDSANSNALQVLSLEVTKTGCPIIYGEINGVPETLDPKTVFPARTFGENNCEEFLRYNSAAFLVNNCMTVSDASIEHTDQNHNVFERDNLGRSDVHSEPTYIGGESHKIECNLPGCPTVRPRPKIALENSIFRFHTNAGTTGVDITVPNVDTAEGNLSIFRFYNNGCAIDKSYGRILILGTSEGSCSCDGSLVDRDSHLDVIQTRAGQASQHQLNIDVATNDDCVIPGATGDSCAVHTIFQGGASNISVGSNQAVINASGLPEPTTTAKLRINGAFISFETAGGSLGFPEASGTTGEGGIFVDKNGCFDIASMLRANISTMVIKSANGVVNLPKNQVFFDNRIGITKWQVDLTNPAERILVDENECISDFTFDWGGVKRDCVNFEPYELKSTPSTCFCPQITAANLTNLPTVKGQVFQFQVKRSRLGDMVHLCVDGEKAHIRELVFLGGFNTAEAPMGLIAIDNFAKVGLGTAHRNVDSLSAQVKLGINGITVVAKGDSIVELNENVIIDNVCHILTGTDFGVEGPQTLTFHSDEVHEFRVKSTGCLDLSSFNNANKIIRFAGSIRVVFEPGAQLILATEALQENGRGKLVFTDKTELAFERVLDPNLTDQTTADALQPILVKWSGIGEVVIEEFAKMVVRQQNFVAVQSLEDCALTTDIILRVNGQAQVEIGNVGEPGGSFQVGNTVDMIGGSVNFELIIDGPGARTEINRQGMLGAAAGVVSKLNVPSSSWTVASLHNVDKFRICVLAGEFSHNTIFPSSDIRAGLLVIGGEAGNVFDFDYDPFNSLVRGGGNVFCIPSVMKKSLSLRRRPSDNTVIIQRDGNLPLDHFSWIPEDSDHAKEINLRLESGATMSGAHGKMCLRIKTRRPLDLGGCDLVRLSKFVAKMPAKPVEHYRGGRRMPINKVIYVAPGAKLVLTKDVEVVNSAREGFMITQDDLAMLTSLLTGSNAVFRAFPGVNPVVEDTATPGQANLLQSKDMFDQRSALPGPVGPAAYHTFLTHINTNDYPHPIASLSPFGVVQSRVGYLQKDTELIRKSIATIINGISGDPTDHQISQVKAAVYHHSHAVTCKSYSFIEIPHLQPGS